MCDLVGGDVSQGMGLRFQKDMPGPQSLCLRPLFQDVNILRTIVCPDSPFHDDGGLSF